MQIFITGVDTNIGKTVISSILCNKYKLNYLKPIQTGEDNDSLFIERKKTVDIKIFNNIYRLKEPLSPLACSIIENNPIDTKFLLKKTKKILKENSNLLIEGAGGIFVPITKDFYMIDFIKKLKIPAILVAEDKLGCINHTILSIKALMAEKIIIERIILNKIKSQEKHSNYNIIKQFTENLNLKLDFIHTLTNES